MLAQRIDYRGGSSGMSWPVDSPVIAAVFGPRDFPAHANNYDYHPGIDFHADAGTPVYAPISGAVIRSHYTCFDWTDASHLAQFEEVDSASSAAWAIVGTALRLTASRVGSQTFPTNVAHLRPVRERMAITGAAATDDWVIEVQLAAAPSVVGGVGIAVVNADRSQYVAIEYDGTTITCRGVDSGGALTNNGTTSAQASKTWLRLEYTQATDTLRWRHSTDGETWTTVATEATHAFTNGAVPLWAPILYWRSGDTDAGTYSIDVEQFNWTPPESIGRFGNWYTIASPGRKVILAHFGALLKLGGFVSPGDLIGYVGNSGFDATSGRIVTPHLHMEYVLNNKSDYSRAESINPLGVGLLPRANVSNNVSVIRTEENDPEAVASHKLAITVARADNDFDLNTITLVGSLATRTINLNTRAGLNADVDEPLEAGVRLVPGAFDEESASYPLDAYFHTSVLGTFTSYALGDTAGTSLATG